MRGLLRAGAGLAADAVAVGRVVHVGRRRVVVAVAHGGVVAGRPLQRGVVGHVDVVERLVVLRAVVECSVSRGSVAHLYKFQFVVSRHGCQ